MYAGAVATALRAVHDTAPNNRNAPQGRGYNIYEMRFVFRWIYGCSGGCVTREKLSRQACRLQKAIAAVDSSRRRLGESG